MSTNVVTELPRTRSWPEWRPRLVSAEVLKLRRRRGLVLAALLLTVVPMVIGYAVLIAMHAADSGKHGPAGGLENFVNSMDFLSHLGVVAAILIGATLGTGDLGAGVFRELVVTGRSRLALFAARVPAGLALLVPLVAAAFAIAATAATLLTGTLQPPSADLLLHSAGWLVLVTAASLMLAIGVSSLLGSRATSIGILLGWQLVAMPLLLQIGALGSLREILTDAAGRRLAPEGLVEGAIPVPMSLGAAVAVLIAWTVVALALGAWRTQTRDA